MISQFKEFEIIHINRKRNSQADKLAKEAINLQKKKKINCYTAKLLNYQMTQTGQTYFCHLEKINC
jgi:hypothetical protein